MATEHSYVRAIHRQLPPTIYALKINLRFHNGVPDAWYSGDAGDCWVEYKYLPRTPSRRFTPALSANQKLWLRDRYHEGRTVAVIVGCPGGGMVLTDLQWEQPVNAKGKQWLGHKKIAGWITAAVSSISMSEAN